MGRRENRCMSVARAATGGSPSVLPMLAGCAACAWVRVTPILPLCGTVAPRSSA
ncbi:hypothetical protein JK222_14095 [Gluconobacter cerinus]|uniref:hypothetical protein n=1 Tax=Gluconobacter cerinus TaxID=38307 RepID=UPI001B8B211E|nr:hypothetical protein [Gluconobacter cerinus]MBS1072816.1 hypothetical protein [Gluconobacter cerinus]